MKLFMTLARLTNRDISKDWCISDMTYTMDACDWKDHFPWNKEPSMLVTTTYTREHDFSQQYGRFRCKFQMQPGWCFWLLNLEAYQYLEVDHFEIFDERVAVTTYKNPHFNSQKRIPHRDYMNPHYEGHIPFMKTFSRMSWKSKKVREYLLAKPRRYEIVWRRWFILWRVDGFPVGLTFRNIPRQPLFPVVTGPKTEDIEELEVKF